MFKKKLKKLVRKLYKFFEYQRFQSLLMKNLPLQNKFQGKRIFILGNGASLNDIDLSLLKNEIAMGCNLIMLHKDLPKLDLCFYADAASKRAIEAAGSPKIIKIRGPIPTGSVEKALFSLNEITQETQTQFFFDVSMKKFIEQNRLFWGHEIFYVMSGDGLDTEGKIELDLTKPLSTMEGSLYFMINLALFMGFTEIYLCGCGYTYSPQQLYHFYETKAGVAHDEIDPRHQLLQKIAMEKNVKIFNVIPEGFESPIYQPVSMGELKTILSPNDIAEEQKRALQ